MMRFAQNCLFLAAGFCLAQIVVISFAVDDLKKSAREIREDVDLIKVRIELLQKRTSGIADRVDTIYNEIDKSNQKVAP
jgi:chaperonin cofactor prefoldin